MKDWKYITYSTKTGAISIFVITSVVLLVNITALFFNRKSVYRCSCFKLFVTSVLLSTLASTLICSVCNIVLFFVIYKQGGSVLHGCYRTLQIMAVYAEYVCTAHIVLISFQRYIAVVFPLQLNDLWVLTNATVVVAAIWSILLVVFVALTVLDFFIEADVLFKIQQVQSVLSLCIILVLVFYYTKIVYKLVQRVRNVKLSSTSTIVRSATICIALGVAFVMAFLPRAIHVLFFSETEHMAWTIYVYITSYSFDSFLVIMRCVGERHFSKQKIEGSSIRPQKKELVRNATLQEES